MAEHDEARVPAAYVTPDGAQLGSWVNNQRSTWKSTSSERRHRLERLPGWTLDSRTAFWEDGFRHLGEYAAEFGAAQPPSNYVRDGFKLGVWVNTQRQNWATLDADRRHRLEQLAGWALNTKVTQWEEGFGRLTVYVEENGTARVPGDCLFRGFELGQWITVQRSGWDSLHADRRERLAALPGWAVSVRDAWWEGGYSQIQQYADENGDACPPPELHQCKRIQPRLMGRNTASKPRQGTAKRRATETAAHAARLGMDAAIRSDWMNTDRSATQHR